MTLVGLVIGVVLVSLDTPKGFNYLKMMVVYWKRDVVPRWFSTFPKTTSLVVTPCLFSTLSLLKIVPILNHQLCP